MEIFSVLNDALGLEVEQQKLGFVPMALRGIVVFIASLIMLRLSARRFLPHKTAFDAILFFILASMLSRAINGGSAFYQTLGVGFVLVGLHRLIAVLACASPKFGILVKGREAVLVHDGKLFPEALRRHALSEDDLREELRLNGNVSEFEEVREARFERSGEISVVKNDNRIRPRQAVGKGSTQQASG